MYAKFKAGSCFVIFSDKFNKKSVSVQALDCICSGFAIVQVILKTAMLI
jgi:hypothetical protein